MKVDLSKYDNSWYDPGRGWAIRTLWYFSNALFLKNSLNPSSKLKICILRLFGAKIGKRVVIKPGVNIKYPWNIEIGDYSWIGEEVWLDSLGQIKIGSNVCISQGAYLCTGNHDWTDPAFHLIIRPIRVEDGAWVGAKSVILPGVILNNYSVIAAGVVIAADTESYGVYTTNSAIKVKMRELRHCNRTEGEKD